MAYDFADVPMMEHTAASAWDDFDLTPGDDHARDAQWTKMEDEFTNVNLCSIFQRVLS
jgi:hypothetical protein